MRRPHAWHYRLLLIGLLLVAGQYAALAWLVPRYVLRAVERAAGGRLLIDRVTLDFPLTTTLGSLRLAGNSEAFAVSVQRVIIKPRWCWLPSRTVWLDTLEFERPLLRVSRTQDGAVLWPSVRLAPDSESGEAATPQETAPDTAIRAPWTIHVGSIKVTEGVVEFVDRKTSRPFHGLVDHVSLELGPVAIRPGILRTAAPSDGGVGTSFAARGKVLGDGGYGAPLYCSGWMDPSVKDLQASCQLAPIALAAFEPYFAGPPEVRVYSATLKATSQWSARANQFTGRMQLELNDLAEGDLSIRGRTILDVKRLTGGQEPRLSGEMTLSGSLDDPRGWHAEFVPGDERVQQLVKQLLDRGVEMIRLTLWGHDVRLALAPSTLATMTDIEAASREVQDALEILAGPPPEEAPPAAPTETGQAAGQPAAPEGPRPAEPPSTVPPAEPAPAGAPVPPSAPPEMAPAEPPVSPSR